MGSSVARGVDNSYEQWTLHVNHHIIHSCIKYRWLNAGETHSRKLWNSCVSSVSSHRFTLSCFRLIVAVITTDGYELYLCYVRSTSISFASLLATSLDTENVKLCAHAMFIYLLYLLRNKTLKLELELRNFADMARNVPNGNILFLSDKIQCHPYLKHVNTDHEHFVIIQVMANLSFFLYGSFFLQHHLFNPNRVSLFPVHGWKV